MIFLKFRVVWLVVQDDWKFVTISKTKNVFSLGITEKTETLEYK